jgi:predicted DCC family thiol-disulfide oxidoreductase YuxK
VEATPPRNVLYYDGVCGLCDHLVRFVLRRDRRDRFRFAPLQSELARRTLAAAGRDASDLDTVYVRTRDGRLLDRARAVLWVIAELGGAWRLVRVFGVLPTFLLDAVYRLVARTRYRLFGRFDACRLPSAEEREKFLGDEPLQ